MKITKELEVCRAKHEDIYKDTARICETDRGEIPEGKICRVKVLANGKAKLLAVRGLQKGRQGIVRLDDFPHCP